MPNYSIIFSHPHPKLVFLWSSRYYVINTSSTVTVTSHSTRTECKHCKPTPQSVHKPKETSLEIPRGKSHVARRKNIPAPGVRLECHCIRGSRIISISCFDCEQIPWLIRKNLRDHEENSTFGFNNKSPGMNSVGQNAKLWVGIL